MLGQVLESAFSGCDMAKEGFTPATGHFSCNASHVVLGVQGLGQAIDRQKMKTLLEHKSLS